MRKYLSLVFLYNKASYKKLLPIIAIIPLCFLAMFWLRAGSSYEASPNMLIEKAFGGIWAVLIFIVANGIGVLSVAGSLNGKKAVKGTSATTGYTIRRLRLSPISSYFTIFFYYIAVIFIFWGVTLAAIYIVGKVGLVMAGAAEIDMKLALGLLRTDIGHALLPIAHPTVILFNLVAIIALAGECAKSCYLSWHNGTPSAGIVLVLISMFLVWNGFLENGNILMVIVILLPYTAISIGDMIYREKRPKGDPFRVNKYEGIIDLDSIDFVENDFSPKAGGPNENSDPEYLKKHLPQIYDREPEAGSSKNSKNFNKLNPAWLRRKFMPVGINLERAGHFFGVCIAIGVIEHMFFFGKYLLTLKQVNNSITGITIDAGVKMPYFWDLEEHTYYGYIIGILMVLIFQIYWNCEYYNKKTKSVFVMKRLPDRKEYLRTIWVSPVIQALFIVLVMVLHTVIDLCMYILITPDIALQADYLSHILPV